MRVSPGLPLLGESAQRWRPCPPITGPTGTHGSERGELVGRGRLAGAEQVLGGAGGEKARGRCGGGCENLKKKVQALRGKQKVLCKEVAEPQSQSPPGKAENAEGEECAR